MENKSYTVIDQGTGKERIVNYNQLVELCIKNTIISLNNNTEKLFLLGCVFTPRLKEILTTKYTAYSSDTVSFVNEWGNE